LAPRKNNADYANKYFQAALVLFGFRKFRENGRVTPAAAETQRFGAPTVPSI
jgi:hypothetical protein